MNEDNRYAEQRFKDTVRQIVIDGEYPGPTVIKRRLGQGGKLNNLNGRQSRWRREIMIELGIDLKRPGSINTRKYMYDDYPGFRY